MIFSAVWIVNSEDAALVDQALKILY